MLVFSLLNMADPVTVDEKIYMPEVIPDTPFPVQDNAGSPVVVQSVNPTNQVYEPATIADTPFRQLAVADEVVSTQLNTKTKKIIGSFEFTPTGAIQIGNYQNGDAGDIRISPIGIIARDVFGNTTFALDGDTGDALFKGTIRAGTLISDSIIKGGSVNINDNFTIDVNGNVVANSIKIATQGYKYSGVAMNQTFTSGAQVDITNGTYTFTLAQATIVLILCNAIGYCYQGSGSGDWGGFGLIRLIVDGAEINRTIINGSKTGSDSQGAVHATPMGLHYLASLAAGTHTIKLTGAADQGTGTNYFVLYSYLFSYMTLGNS